MATDAGESDGARLSPDDAFGALGNETRMEILQTLGTDDDPVSFSDLRERVGMRDSGQFNYHLDKLIGHFVEQTEDGYDLRQAGRRVIEAVLSGAVTDAPEVDLTRIDEPCHFCGSQVTIRYREERVRVYCTECHGMYGSGSRPDATDVPSEYGYLGALPLPPAGVQERTPEDAYRAAWTWGNLEILAIASGVCPRCSATIDHSTVVCEQHDATDGLCDECGRRHAVYLDTDCTTCNYEHGGGIVLGVATETALLSFLLEHDVNPITPEQTARRKIDHVHENYTEELLDTDPLEARFTFTIDDDELSLTVDETLAVVNTSR